MVNVPCCGWKGMRPCGKPATARYGLHSFCRECLYSTYLKSRAWENVRKRMIRIAEKRCQLCGQLGGRGKNGNVTGLNVHHLTYERLTVERDEDMVVLCRDCHGRLHKLPKADPLRSLKAIRLATSFPVYEALISGHDVPENLLSPYWLRAYTPAPDRAWM